MVQDANPPRIDSLPGIQALFEGQADVQFEASIATLRLIIYSPRLPDSEITLGILDKERNEYSEISLARDAIHDCRLYTADQFSQGFPVSRFRLRYEGALAGLLPPEWKRRLLPLFLDQPNSVERNAGGLVITGADEEGRYRERIIEIRKAYL